MHRAGLAFALQLVVLASANAGDRQEVLRAELAVADSSGGQAQQVPVRKH
jgi:hypothetical protein